MRTMQKKTIEIWMGFEIDADENWELSKQNIDNLIYAIKTGKYGLTRPIPKTCFVIKIVSGFFHCFPNGLKIAIF